MAIFNESFTDNLLVLNEKKTREEYRKRSAKKYFNFEPDKPGSDNGTITDTKGKRYKFVTDEKYKSNDGKMHKSSTHAKIHDSDSTIVANSDIYKLKGSHKGERIKAAIEHEIGHQNLHNYHPDNKTVDTKNRNFETFRRLAADSNVNVGNPSYNKLLKEYLKTSTASSDDVKDRLKSIRAAEKYENKQSDHTKAEEFEADRFAANRTSDRAVRNMIKNVYRNQDRDIKAGKNPNQTVSSDDTKREGHIDQAQRLKALKDKEIKNGKAYK